MIRTSVESDIGRIAGRMRESDCVEVWKSHNHSPADALKYSYEISPMCMTLVHKGEPVAMFGLCPDGPEQPKQATVWLLGTDQLRYIWRIFLKLSVECVSWMLEIYPVLYNFVDAENHTSIRWLTWLGARFEEPAPYGKEGRMFRQFVIERKPNHV